MERYYLIIKKLVLIINFDVKKLSEEKIKIELDRLKKMKEYENKYPEYIIAGVDEAGRGPLAGPVVAGCVVLPKDVDILFINDSKKLSEKKREELFVELKEKSLAYGIGVVSEKIIDDINILEATHLAMKEAVENAQEEFFKKYNKKFNLIFVDAISSGKPNIKKIDIKQVSFAHGDAISISIAAASIIAKVTRDHMMIEYDRKYPEYGFIKHKGYGTKLHYEAIKKYGMCDIHRKSFLNDFCKEKL